MALKGYLKTKKVFGSVFGGSELVHPSPIRSCLVSSHCHFPLVRDSCTPFIAGKIRRPFLVIFKKLEGVYFTPEELEVGATCPLEVLACRERMFPSYNRVLQSYRELLEYESSNTSSS